MLRRPTHDWLEVLVSTALISGCGGSTAPASPHAAHAEPVAVPPPPEPSPEAAEAPVASSEPPPRLELPAFDPTTCKGPIPPSTEPPCAEETEQNLVHLRANCAVDALVLYEVARDSHRDGVLVPGKAVEIARSGEPCSGAADKERCEESLKNPAFPRKAGFGYPVGTRNFLVVARGAALEVVSNREQLVGLIGPVDSKQDVAAFLWLDGWYGSCASVESKGAGFVIPKYPGYVACPALKREDESSYQIPGVPRGFKAIGDYRLQVDRRGAITVSYLGRDKKHPVVRCGRSPSGMELAGPPPGASDVGAYLAASAELEAAAVIAFELLASELAAHGAPAALVQRCRLAARDERRHTELMTAAARRYGAEPVVPSPLQRPLPTLLELARENTVEGCVRETWGALSAALQARTAQDERLAAMYASIAPDELAHAELSWDIQAWLCERTGEARQLDDLARAAHAELLAEQIDPAPAVAALTGAPLRATARQLIGALASG